MVCSCVFQITTAEAALFHFFFFLELSARFTQMIGLLTARGAEVVLTFRASNSILTHVLCSSLIDEFPFIVFNIIVDFSFNNLDHIATFALDEILLPFKGFICKLYLKL